MYINETNWNVKIIAVSWKMHIWLRIKMSQFLIKCVCKWGIRPCGMCACIRVFLASTSIQVYSPTNIDVYTSAIVYSSKDYSFIELYFVHVICFYFIPNSLRWLQNCLFTQYPHQIMLNNPIDSFSSIQRSFCVCFDFLSLLFSEGNVPVFSLY